MHSGFSDIDLANSNYWETESFSQQTSVLTPDGSHRVIADFDIPLFNRSRIMAARFFNPFGKPWWKLGCHLNQTIPAPFGPSESLIVASWRIPLYLASSKRQLIFFPDPVSSVWRLTASVPSWHTESQIIIWRFTGDLPNPPIKELLLLRGQQSEIELKIDEILSRL